MSSEWIVSQAYELKQQLVEVRKDIHKNPELSFQESRTAEKGIAWFKGLGLPTRTQIANTHGVLATLDTGKPGPTVLIRGDMDALPIQEETGADFSSCKDGVMHACGHDVHTTCAMGVAKLFKQNQDKLRGKLHFLLQPAEETPPGGAKILVEEGGILEGVDLALALHVHPQVPLGTLGLRGGLILAHTANFGLRIFGKGGHVAKPHLCRDPIPVAAQICLALQNLVSRENNPFEPLVVCLGQLHAGTASNIIPEEAVMQGTIRCLNKEKFDAFPKRIEALAKSIASAAGCTYEMEYDKGYPGLYNNPELTDRAALTLEKELGSEKVIQLPHAELGGEDFSYIAEKVPSLFMRLGVQKPGEKVIPLHSPKFLADENCIPLGVAGLASVAFAELWRD